MSQDIYFPSRPSLDSISGVYTASSLFLLGGVVIFGLIFLIALISITKILVQIRKAAEQQRSLYVEMEMFYKKQLKLLHGKQFFHSFYQYTKLLVQLHKGKDVHAIWHMLGYDSATILYIESVIREEKDLDYEQEKRIKEILHQHLQ